MADKMTDRSAMLRKLQQAEFSAYDSALFLDTHNTDQEALTYYSKMNQSAKELEDDFTAKYGPLHIGETRSQKMWEWSKGPWPWEYSAN